MAAVQPAGPDPMMATRTGRGEDMGAYLGGIHRLCERGPFSCPRSRSRGGGAQLFGGSRSRYIRNTAAAAKFETHFERLWGAAQPMDEFGPAINALEPK